MKLIPRLIAAIFATLLTATALADCITPPTNMVAWWTGDGHSRDVMSHYLGGGSGSFVTGKVGKALQFNGQPMMPINPPDLVCSNGFSIEMWLRLDSLIVGDVFFSRTNAESIFRLYFDQTSLGSWGSLNYIRASLTTPGGANAVLDGGSIPTNTWVHIGFACASNGFVYLMMNGNVVDSSAWTVPPVISGGSLAIGGSGLSAVTLDEISIYDRFLAPAEMNSIYTGGSDGKCKRPDLALITTVSESPALVGTNITWTVVLTNRGVAGASNVALSLSMPYQACDMVTSTVPFTIGGMSCLTPFDSLRCMQGTVDGSLVRLSGANDILQFSHSATASVVLNFFGTGTYPLTATATAQIGIDENPADNTNTLNLVVAGTPQLRMTRLGDKAEIYWACQSDWMRLEQTLCTTPFEWEGATNSINWNSYHTTVISNLVNAPSRLYRLHEINPYPGPGGDGLIDPGSSGLQHPLIGPPQLP